MNPYAAQSQQAYRENAVMTATPEQLVVMLYDGAIRFLRQAEVHLGDGRRIEASERMGRAEAIIDELLATLNMDAGELSERLQAIYVFCKRCLIEARIEREPGKIGHVIRLLGDLRGAWAEIAVSPAAAGAPAPAAPAPAAPPAAPAAYGSPAVA